MDRFLKTGLCAVVFFTAAAAGAQTYPERPIHIITGFAVGGPTDVTARAFGNPLSRRLGQPVIVEARVGAGGRLAANAVAKAAPDGYTLYYGPLAGINPVLLKNGTVGGKDLAPIANLMSFTYIYSVRGDLPIKTLAEFVAYSKSKEQKGGMDFGQAGAPNGLFTRLLSDRTGLAHTPVPYNGAAQVTQALLAGQVEFMTGSSVPKDHVASGKIRPLFSGRKTSQFPDLPTSAEFGIRNFDIGGYYGLWAPIGTPRAIIDKLAAETSAIARTPEVAQQFLSGAGGEAMGSTPEEQMKQYQAEIDVLTEAARLANFTAE